MVPSAATWTFGVNAWVAGTWLIWIFFDHVRPPSSDCENAMPACSLLLGGPLKLPSCQTAYPRPGAPPAAKSGMMSPVRMRWPVSGSVTSTTSTSLTLIGDDQLSPRSGERMTATSQHERWTPEPWNRNVPFTSVGTEPPLGTTTIWFPIVNEIPPSRSKIGRAGSQDTPLSVERAKTVCERSANVCPSAVKLTLSLGNVLWSQTA